MNPMLRHQIIFQCIVLILFLVGQHLCQDSGNSASTWTSSLLENEVDDTLSLFTTKIRLLH